MWKLRKLQKTRELGYRQRDNVEHEGYDGAHSGFHGEMDNQNGVHLFEKIIFRNNLNQAYLQVVRNGGTAGVDGMTYDQLLPYLREYKEELLKSLRNGTFRPQPVLRS
ncbi:RNA-directed DNA polymerase [Lederbergia lenta]|uniref:RNA-directed DNA polymerase n=1 Tax=Lederbergia lenta TaxID=1467 RepID=A0A2X4ZDL2_LEDLE|nr:hypothetical protein [Lederbergia lenta]SQI62645.1 RNA-directed DNA polymerase [Lederbergia lenta]